MLGVYVAVHLCCDSMPSSNEKTRSRPAACNNARRLCSFVDDRLKLDGAMELDEFLQGSAEQLEAST